MSNVQDLFKKEKRQWVEEARQVARKIGSNKREFTIEDVLAEHSLPGYLHQNTVGSVLKECDEFRKVRYTPSRRRISHGRVIAVWTYLWHKEDDGTNVSSVD